MRVLFTVWAWPTHLYALVPLARACRAAGHDVLVAGQPALAPVVAAAGLPGVSVGRDVDVRARFREFALGRPAPARRSSGPPRALAVLRDVAAAMAADVIECARSWAPDLVVFEPTTLAGPLAAAAAGVPAVRQLYGLDLLYRSEGSVRDVVRDLAREFEGLDTGVVAPLGVRTIDPCPAGLRLPAAYRPVSMRYTPYSGFRTRSRRQPAGDRRRPRVCVTWGTTPARLDPALFLAGRVIEAITGSGRGSDTGMDVDVVAAVTAGQRGLLGQVPSGVRVETDVPLADIVGGCDAVVAHGGAGTVLTALAGGVPALLVPQLPDHAAHARRVADAGAGLVLERERFGADQVRRVLGELLTRSAYRATARRLGREMAASPAPAEVVATLEQLAETAPTR